jgi:hypothetical protein
MSDKEMINSIKEETDFEISQATLTRLKRSLRTDAGKWYSSLINSRCDFIAKVKESWDSLILLQKITWEEFQKSEGNSIVRNKYLNLNLRINEDIIGMLDSLRYIGVLYPMEKNMVERKTLSSQTQFENLSFEESKQKQKGTSDFTFNKTF